LTLGYAMGLRQIDRSVVQEVLTDLKLDPLILKQHGSEEPIESALSVSRSASFQPFQAQRKGGLGARRTLSLAAALLLLGTVGWMTATGKLWRMGYMRSIEVPKSSLPPNVHSLLPQTDGSQSNQEYRSLRTRPVPTMSGYHKSGHAIGPYRNAGVPAQSFSSVLPP
jgi:hypothetical protein